ncbi:hypothetical protein [Wolbachia endosymbiont (group A) of Bibio marci]|nr:hypothetical protein [Wolbachia endosymbiont (group A) of Bibio marci]
MLCNKAIPVSGHWDDTSGHCRHKGTSVSYLNTYHHVIPARDAGI